MLGLVLEAFVARHVVVDLTDAASVLTAIVFVTTTAVMVVVVAAVPAWVTNWTHYAMIVAVMELSIVAACAQSADYFACLSYWPEFQAVAVAIQ